MRDDDYDQCECTTQIVLLQTARAVALDETGKIPIPVRMLFDTGSQRTYVTENLPSKLKLKIRSTRKAKSQHNFGEARYKSQNCDLVHLQLKRPGSANNEAIDISALTFPVLFPTALKSTN